MVLKLWLKLGGDESAFTGHVNSLVSWGSLGCVHVAAAVTGSGSLQISVDTIALL